ncbi:MAG: radical SAM protein, partial [Rectinemataceae bacterium]|nr:radical SAM protein [Rectinemataceae bacterium]
MKRNIPILNLVSLQPEEDAGVFPLGAACIAAALVQAKLLPREHISLLTSFVDENPEILASRILTGAPDIVGFSLYCWNSKVSIALAKAIKTDHPEIVLVAGGPDCEALDQADSDMPFDALFLGEAETSFEKWFSASFTAWFKTHCAALEEDPMVLPQALPIPLPSATPPPSASPWLEGILKPKRGDAVAWELTRGCPFHCTYCYEGRGTRGLRHLPDARIAAELELFVRSGVSEVFVLDPTFNVQKARALALLKLFLQKGGNIAWNFEIRAELLDPDQAEAFAKLNCSL